MFTAEKKLMDAIGTGAVINAEVLTFNRMAYRVLKEIGGINKTDLSKCGRAMLIYDILSKNKRKLKYLGKSDENIDMIGTQITEFKKHGVSVEELEEAKNNAENKYLKCKMEDMFLVYNEFQNRIIDKFIDETDRLSMLANKIDETEEFNNSLIYIDEFVGFTKQEYDIIRKLLKVAKMVSITICADNLEEIKNRELSIRISTLEACDPKEIFSDEVNRIIHKTLKNLPEQTHRIFEMSRFENKTVKEIADETNLTIKGVEYHITKALKALRINLKDYLPLFYFLFS